MIAVANDLFNSINTVAATVVFTDRLRKSTQRDVLTTRQSGYRVWLAKLPDCGMAQFNLCATDFSISSGGRTATRVPDLLIS